jgi:pimeloyl-ACP methyl ester carboxylesterase
MRPPDDAVETAGSGPDLILVHGTGMDGASLGPLARLLGDRLRVTRYGRRGTERWPGPGESAPSSAQEHAADLADLASGLAGGRPVHLFGVSFGGVVALELARQRPELVRSAALFEPFHRRVLSEALWRRLSPQAQARARGQWRHIHGDLLATVAYRMSEPELRAIRAPVLLLRGGRSPAAFEAPVRALAAALPSAQRVRIEGAGHQMFGSAWGPLAEALAGFALG